MPDLTISNTEKQMCLLRAFSLAAQVTSCPGGESTDILAVAASDGGCTTGGPLRESSR